MQQPKFGATSEISFVGKTTATAPNQKPTTNEIVAITKLCKSLNKRE